MEHIESTSTEDVFLRLYKYDFKGSPKFIEGWKKIRQLVTEHIKESYIKAQVFFYSRQVEPIDFNHYYQWLTSSGRDVEVLDLEIQDQEKDDHDNDGSTESDVVGPDKLGKHPANFGELIEMIQKGIKLPDVEELNIEPTNGNPSPAKLDRPKKPWET